MNTEQVLQILENNKITNVGNNTPYTSNVTITFTQKEISKIIGLIKLHRISVRFPWQRHSTLAPTMSNIEHTLGGLEWLEELLVKKLRPTDKK